MYTCVVAVKVKMSAVECKFHSILSAPGWGRIEMNRELILHVYLAVLVSAALSAASAAAKSETELAVHSR